ncbi:MAG: hypothetical protein ACRECD_10085 [Burkholderiaceae bacterium]
MVIALPVKLAGAGQLQPGLEVLRYGAVQQGLFGVAGVVDLGSGWRLRVRMLVGMVRVLGRGVPEAASS